MTTLSTECRRLLSSLSAYLDGDLDATACDDIEKHCQRCPRCAEIVVGLRETVGLCREARSIPLPDGVRKRALASVKRLLDSQDDRAN